jgi:hypothetical protein
MRKFGLFRYAAGVASGLYSLNQVGSQVERSRPTSSEFRQIDSDVRFLSGFLVVTSPLCTSINIE